MSDEHHLTREIVKTNACEMKLIDGELHMDYRSAVAVSSKTKQTIECSCGDSFRKERTAREHLEEIRDER